MQVQILNYVTADFYRVIRKKSLYIFLMICSFGFIGINLIISGVNYTQDVYLSLVYILLSFVPIFVGVYVFSLIYTDDLRSKSLQTAIVFGKKRSEIIIVKFIDATVLMLFFIVLIYAHVYFVPMILGLSITSDMVTMLNANVFVAFLKTIGYFALSSVAVFFFQKATTAVTIFILLATGTFHMMLSLLLTQSFVVQIIGNKQPYLFTEVINRMGKYFTTGTGNIVALTVITALYIIVATIIAIAAFNHKELEF